VILDPHDRLVIAARPDGDGCAVTAAPGDAPAERPVIAVIDDACRVALDPAVPSAVSTIATRPPPAPASAARRSRRWGCSAAGDGSGTGLVLTLVLVGLLAQLARSRRIRARGSAACAR
jgi:MYXO-CTERM domain-containing protein